MKPLLYAFLFLLPYGSLCEPVWAETKPLATSPLVPGCGKDNELCMELVQPKPDTAPSLQMLIAGEEAPNPLVCLATMEAAMKAMEPFNPMLSYLRGAVDALESTNALRTNLPEIQAYRKRTNNAQQQWDAAKACWRKP